MTDLAEIVIRPAREADADAVQRLAQLDEARLPEGDLLVAEVAGEVLAAMAIADRAHVADPFSPTGKLVELLDVRAQRLAAERGDVRPRARSRMAHRPRLWQRFAYLRTAA